MASCLGWLQVRTPFSHQSPSAMPLTAAIPTALDLLRRLARLEDFWKEMELVFGPSYDRQQLELLRSDWLRGDSALLPRIEVVSSASLHGAQGAYAESSRDLIR
jgi:hypothetical protein